MSLQLTDGSPIVTPQEKYPEDPFGIRAAERARAKRSNGVLVASLPVFAILAAPWVWALVGAPGGRWVEGVQYRVADWCGVDPTWVFVVFILGLIGASGYFLDSFVRDMKK